MTISISSNQAALLARTATTTHNETITDSTRRLSSGERVISAEDDAAALAVSSNLNLQLASLRTAQRNASGGVSLAQTADGALSEVSGILNRIKELSVQAVSGQISDAERALLDTEYQGLLSEIDRISADTTFNGVQLLNGMNVTQEDRNDLVASQVETGDGFQAFQFEDDVGNGLYKVDFVAATNTMTVTNLLDNTTSSIVIDSNDITAGSTETVLFGGQKMRAVLDSNFNKNANITATNTASVTLGTGAIDAGTISLDSVALAGGDDSFDFGTIDANVITINSTVPGTSTLSIALNGGATTFTGTADLTTLGTKNVTLDDGNGNSLTVSFDVGTAFDGNETAASLTMNEFSQLVASNLTAQTSTDFEFQVGSGSALSDRITVSVAAVNTAALGLGATSLTSALNATTVLGTVDSALTTLNDARASLGAAMQQLEFAGRSIGVAVENSQLALADLMDVDVPAEMTALSSNQALMEASISMLARSNQLPQIILGLLRNS